MKIFTVEEFKSLISEKKWKHGYEIEYSEYRENEDPHSFDGVVTSTDKYGRVKIVSKCEDMTITYLEDFQFDVSDSDSLETALSHDTDFLVFDGFEVEETHPLSGMHYQYLLSLLTDDFTGFDYSDILSVCHDLQSEDA